MKKEHSVLSISELELGQKIQPDKGKGPSDPLANQFNPSKAETSSTHPNERSEILEYEAQEHEAAANPIPLLGNSIESLHRRLRAHYAARNSHKSKGRNDSSVSIYKFPPKLQFGSSFIQEPEIVSIGPHHHGKNHLLEFEHHKLTFLNKFLSKSMSALEVHLKFMRKMEQSARKCYQQESDMSSRDFVEMMLLDGCFIVVLLHLLAGKADTTDCDFIFEVPWRIPILNQDLLKMENQLPFFVLDYLFPFYKDPACLYKDMPSFALNVFSLSFPMPFDTERKVNNTRPLHLLHLVYQGLLPPNRPYQKIYRPSNLSIQSVTRLRLSRIKFRSGSKTNSFLNIKYKRLTRVLEIPTITISDYTKCLLINCVALEQSHQNKFGTYCYFTDYIAFMNLLISEPKDVAFLCADGIISNFSQGDTAVVDWLNNFRALTVYNNRNSYFLDELRNLEAYYSSYWATVLRNYFSSPWSFISVFTAFLLIVSSLIQTSFTVAGYYKKHSN